MLRKSVARLPELEVVPPATSFVFRIPTRTPSSGGGGGIIRARVPRPQTQGVPFFTDAFARAVFVPLLSLMATPKDHARVGDLLGKLDVVSLSPDTRAQLVGGYCALLRRGDWPTSEKGLALLSGIFQVKTE